MTFSLPNAERWVLIGTLSGGGVEIKLKGRREEGKKSIHHDFIGQVT